MVVAEGPSGARVRGTGLAFNANFGAVVVGGTGLALWSVLGGPLVGFSPDPYLAGLFLALIVLGEAKPVRWLFRTGSNHITPTWAFIAGLVLITDGYVAAALTMAASMIGDLSLRRHPSRVLFNGAMLSLSVGAGIAVLAALGARQTMLDQGPLTLSWAAAVMLAFGAMFVVNNALVSLVIALREGLPLTTVVKRDTGASVVSDGLLLSLGPVLVVLGRASPLLLAPVLIVWYLVFRSGEIAARRQHEATHDPLTGLPNRRLFFERLREAVAHRGTRSEGVLGVLILDLDDFKQINDNLGHDVGDAVLIELALRLRKRVGDRVLVARLDGDEFAVMVERAEDLDVVWGLGRALHAATAMPLVSNGFPLTVSGSIGIAVSEPFGEPTMASTLMRRADVAMYSAKVSGRGVMVFGRDISDDSAPGRLALVSQLGNAIEGGQLSVHYQPITDVVRGATDRLEALVRWDHPVLGSIGPMNFVPMAEQTDLIGPLTAQVIESALRDCAGWIAGGHDVGIAINVSARVLHDLRFPASLQAAVERAGLDPTAVTLEITENAVLREPGRAARVLSDLRQLGVRVSVDDFGTGFSSLSSLRDLPLDELKIDRRFVGAILEDTDDEIIVRTVVALANQMGLSTVAEGAETQAITDRLIELGCDVLQGFHLARPMPGPEVAGWLAAHRPVVDLAHDELEQPLT